MDWEDVRIFLAVARVGTVSHAARDLAINPSTVTRRLANLESRLNVRLFDRLSTGYDLTEVGRQLQAEAARLELDIVALERQVSAQDSVLSGTVRVSVPIGMGSRLMGALARFMLAYPQIELQLLETDVPVNLGMREADLALRVTNQPPEHLIGRRIGRSRHGLYGTHDYLQRYPYASQQRLILDIREGSEGLPSWAKALCNPQVVLRSSSREARFHAALAGLGLAVLPETFVDDDSGLVRMEGIDPMPEYDIWLLTHASLRNTSRVHLIQDYIAEYYKQRERST